MYLNLTDSQTQRSANNVTERVIKQFTIGRGNWLFMNTVSGVNAS
ncbi:IS66 family transposase [Thomasclavelia cocleata]